MSVLSCHPKANKLFDSSQHNTNFFRSHPTKILIHGFSDHGVTSWIKKFRKSYLDVGDFNIISVDWGPLAESPWYTTAAKNAQ